MNTNKKNILIVCLVSICFLILLFWAVSINHKMQREYAEVQKKWEEKEAAYQEEIAALKEQIGDLEKEKKEAREVPQDAETEEPEEEKKPEVQESYLENLDEKNAGDILRLDELNPEEGTRYFTSYEIQEGDAVYQRIHGKSYRENENIGLSDLAYLKMLHWNFQGEIQVGEMIVNVAIAQDVLEAFHELFNNQYQIQSMYLVDNYWIGDGNDTDTASIDANNTSAFNYRPITGGGNLSNHAYGRAIDINPQQNPYVWYDSAGNPNWSHTNANDYIDRSSGLAHVITHEDLCYQVFTAHGFSWGGDWSDPKDYQHFEKR